jgi:U3 small nucleolar RNA-associated protein 16
MYKLRTTIIFFTNTFYYRYAASAKRKRQERELMLKEQAEKRKRKRQRKSKGDDFSDDEEGSGEDDEGNPAKRQRRTKGPLPNMLPEGFLTDSSSEDEDDSTTLKKMVKRKKPKKINFETALQVLDAEGKGPRDEVVGSTRYRVLAKQGDERLAPKINKDSKRAKEALMRRGRQAVVVNKKRGFFIKR